MEHGEGPSEYQWLIQIQDLRFIKPHRRQIWLKPTKCKGPFGSSHHGYLSPAQPRNPEEEPPAWLWAHPEGGKWHIWRCVQGKSLRFSHSLSPPLETSLLSITWLMTNYHNLRQCCLIWMSQSHLASTFDSSCWVRAKFCIHWDGFEGWESYLSYRKILPHEQPGSYINSKT